MLISRLKIEKQVYQGWGLGFSDNKAIFVEQAIDGDIVDAEIVKDHKAHAFAKIKEIVQASPFRVISPCPYTRCGGCHWQTMAYERQVHWKRAFVQESIGSLVKGEHTFEFRESEKAHSYRSRITLRMHVDEKGKHTFGFFEQHTYNLIPIASCSISMPAINEFLQKLSACDFSLWPDKKFRLEIQVYPENNQDEPKHISVVVTSAQKNTENLNAFLQIISRIENVLTVKLAGDTKNNLDFFFFGSYGGADFFNSPGQFQQVNLTLNNMLRDDLMGNIKNSDLKNNESKILDLFAGSGNLSIALAKAGYQVTAVEQNKISVASAKQNIKKNNIKTMIIEKADSASFIKGYAKNKQKFPWRHVLLDPPRAGALGVCRDLVLLKPEYITYISCDLATLRRDLKVLLEGSYVINKIYSYDFFPSTFHIETMVLLSRTNSQDVKI